MRIIGHLDMDASFRFAKLLETLRFRHGHPPRENSRFPDPFPALMSKFLI